jgi:transcriptional regulator with XRE-family HTH domain
MENLATKMKKIGVQIHDARVEKGWSQKKLAEETTVSFDTINGIETGRIKNVSLIILQLLAEKLDVSFTF